MSRGTKRGFQRLDTHEMAELDRNGRTKLDSGSEDDILNLTVEEHAVGRASGGCYGCCVWFSVLYMGLLTILVLLLGAFSGYILVSTWQVDQHSNSTSNTIRDDFKKLRDDLDSHTKHTYHVLNGLQQTAFDANASSYAVNASVSASILQLTKSVEDIDERLKKLENHPQGVLIQQIESIHHEMAILDGNMEILNQSLDELHDMRGQMASMDSVLNSYDAKLKDLSATIGDTIHGNTDIQDSVQGFADRIQNFSNQMFGMDTRMNQSHEAMQRVMDRTNTNFSNLQSLVGNLNETMNEDMKNIWTNLTGVETAVTELRTDVNTLVTNLTTLGETLQQMPAQKEEVTSTTPPLPPSTKALKPHSDTMVSISPEDVVTMTTTSTVAASTMPKVEDANATPPTHVRIADEIVVTDSSPDVPEETTGMDNEASTQSSEINTTSIANEAGKTSVGDDGGSDKGDLGQGGDADGQGGDADGGQGDGGQGGDADDGQGDGGQGGADGGQGDGGQGGDADGGQGGGDGGDGDGGQGGDADGSQGGDADGGHGGDEGEGSQGDQRQAIHDGIQMLQTLYDEFAKWDENGDGVLSVNEFTSYLPVPSIFATLDESGNGSVEKWELQTALERLRKKGSAR